MAKKTKSNQIPHHKKAAFLAAYAECGTVTRAAIAAKVDRTSHNRWLESDSEYAKQFAEAGDTAADKLEDEARRRAHDGLLKMKFHQGSPIIDPRTKEPYFELEYSDTLLIFLLKGARPKKFRDNMDLTSGDKPLAQPKQETPFDHNGFTALLGKVIAGAARSLRGEGGGDHTKDDLSE